MDLGSGILASTSTLTIGLTIIAAIISWRDRRVKEIELKLIQSIRRERRLKYRERQCRDALYAIYGWVYWAQRNLITKPGAPPAPHLPEHPQFDDVETNEDEIELENDEKMT